MGSFQHIYMLHDHSNPLGSIWSALLITWSHLPSSTIKLVLPLSVLGGPSYSGSTPECRTTTMLTVHVNWTSQFWWTYFCHQAELLCAWKKWKTQIDMLGCVDSTLIDKAESEKLEKDLPGTAGWPSASPSLAALHSSFNSYHYCIWTITLGNLGDVLGYW